MNNKYSVTSFFCGCGGLDLGFRGDFTYHDEKYRKLPFEIKAAYDFNAPCVETYNHYFGKYAHQADLSQMSPNDFEKTESGAVRMLDTGRKKFLTAWQEHKKEIITHPYLQEKLHWGLVPYVQALLLARYIRFDLDEYPPFLWK